MDRQKEVKRNKIRVKSNTKRSNEASRRLVSSVSLLPETIEVKRRYVQNPEQVSHRPRWINGEALLPMNRLSWKYLGCKCNQMSPIRGATVTDYGNSAT